MSDPNASAGPAGTPDRFAVSVILAVSAPSASGEVVGVVAGDRGGDDRLLRSDGAGEQVLCPGFQLRLYKDEAESYYMNLTGERPSVFVVCQAAEDESPRPVLVTLSYDEASSYMEVEDAVFSVPMPPEIYRWVETFVLEHYTPERKKKRKLDNWKEDPKLFTSPRFNVCDGLDDYAEDFTRFAPLGDLMTRQMRRMLAMEEEPAAGKADDQPSHRSLQTAESSDPSVEEEATSVSSADQKAESDAGKAG
ncbi:MAG: DUF3305 domain-containing protein [Pseudomonadota bacterium]|nr:DUF3305 domain-containing protein [Pseudomonadota bacterium]